VLRNFVPDHYTAVEGTDNRHRIVDRTSFFEINIRAPGNTDACGALLFPKEIAVTVDIPVFCHLIWQ